MIEAEELTKVYGRVTAVDGLSFRVRPGRVTGFLGPNGAGKSTTLRMILGLNAPTSGSVTVCGRRFGARARGLRHVGALLDAAEVHGGRTGRAHLWALARGNRIGRDRVARVLEEVGLSGAAHRRVGTYSLGMRQRLGIAAALLGDPPVLLFDEPLNGLDPEGVWWVRGLFRSLAAEGRTVFVSSHLMSEMQSTADELVVVGAGRLLAAESLGAFAARGSAAGVTVRTGTPDALAALTALLRARGATVRRAPGRADGRGDGRGEEPADGAALTVTGLDAPRIGALALEHRIPLDELTTRAASLEDAFRELTAASVDYPSGDPR